MMRKLYLVLLCLSMVLILSCNKQNELNNETIANSINEAINNDLNINFNALIEDMRKQYQNSEKVVTLEFRLMDDNNAKIEKLEELEGIEATLVLATIDNQNGSIALKNSSACSSKDVRKGNCYTYTCYGKDGGESSGKCTGGAFGSCLKKGKSCLDSGGCFQMCRIPPKLVYIPRELDNEGLILNEDHILIFPGQD